MGNEEVFNTIQEVLRALTVSLALEQKADMVRLGSALQAFATNPKISPEASAMLADLAAGVTMIGKGNMPKN